MALVVFSTTILAILDELVLLLLLLWHFLLDQGSSKLGPKVFF